jgi:hypothetical protein
MESRAGIMKKKESMAAEKPRHFEHLLYRIGLMSTEKQGVETSFKTQRLWRLFDGHCS